ncbi:RluA family pseudouridine synthase [Cohnella candidum]|uniref:Pseudouridine synthase n=1 Tax=Cohnella candidum TaxID=2674991 RepID=A0A3G3K1E4_9BACL|nr:RluA family pseudouridine synthase [Cohnella candidum]AYQ73589.1 RluA family pseudouridine synthase [Cohnella candidum]
MTSETGNRYYEPIALQAEASDDGRLLREVLQRRLGISRRLLVKLKSTEVGITVNGRRTRTNEAVAAGDLIELRIEREESPDILPQPMELDIVFEDDHLLVVNKPAGQIVHPTTGHYMGTLANGIVHYWKERGEKSRFHPVHRLDEWTSGLVVVAKHAFAHQQLAEQMTAGTVEKLYRAYVYGEPPERSGEVNAPIGRSSEDPHRRIVREDGAPSQTFYEVAESYACGGASALDIRLGTGRTHQIRVHMLHAGCPLIGDDYYSDAVWQASALSTSLKGVIGRQALHAIRLSFRHPVTGEPLKLNAALPADLRNLEGALRAWHKEN